jgi:aminopeptidase-like protein
MTKDSSHNKLHSGVTIGDHMYSLIEKMFPICRSITGAGVRQSLEIISGIIPIEVHEIPSGKKVFDWEVPNEWNVRDAFIKNSRGEKIVDFKNCNLHVLNYSIPVRKTLSLAELKNHLFYLPQYPDRIPYRTSYYKEDWGFCISYNQFQALQEETYDVCIDSSLEPGHLTYGEFFIPGQTDEEILISTHICHPSLANDNLSGNSVAVFLAEHLRQVQSRYSYRFLFIPGTIGAITWLAINENNIDKIKHGLVLSLLGDTGAFTYKKSRRDTAEIDQIVEYLLKAKNSSNKVIDFIPYGYDERQYCSPGINLSVGCLSRTPYGQYNEYHTSADDLSFIKASSLEEAFVMVREILQALEANKKYLNLNPKCEPQLGKRGLYSLKGGNNDGKEFQMALLWTLNLSDGKHTILDISKRSAIHFSIIKEAVDRLVECQLLEEAISKQ